MKRYINSILFATLFVLAESGQVSIVKDLDDKTCKIMACKLRQLQSCLPSKCDEEGNFIYTNTGNACSMHISKWMPRQIECIK